VDTLNASKLQTTAAGRVDIDLGPEGGSANFLGAKTAIHGYLNANLGGGGNMSFQSASTIVDGPITLTGGSEADSVSITGAKTLFKSKFTFDGRGGDDSFTSAGGTLAMQGLVRMDGGAGDNDFEFGATKNLFGRADAAGSVDLKLGEGAGSVDFTGNVTRVLGNLKIDMGTGGGSAHLRSVETTIRDSVQATGGAGNDTLGFEGRTSIGKSLSFAGNAGDDMLTAMGSLFSVNGATSMDGGSGASTFDLHPVTLAMAAVTLQGGVENDRVSIIADGTISGDVNLQLGADGTGPSSVTLQSQTSEVNGLKFGKSLTIDMVGATADALTIANIQVASTFVAQTGEGVSTVTVSGLNTQGDLSLQTGSGADLVNVDNVNAQDFYLDTQIGADELRIERNSAYAGVSRVNGVATILTGIGGDEIRIGNSSDEANLLVSFNGAVTLDAGDGPNMRNDVLGSNFFRLTPTILSTGGTMTQTEAV
jgi:hypothetical protein